MRKELLNLGFKLFLIAAVAGLALGLTNAITAGPIEAQRIAEANAARVAVLPSADSFTQLPDAPDGLDEIYVGRDAAGNAIGLTGKCTVTGFGGPIELTVGMDAAGVITGVIVGGSDFAETAGLGAHVKDAWFGEQFIGKRGAGSFDATSSATGSSEADGIALKKDGGTIDAVTSATISSAAVTSGVAKVTATLNTVWKGVQ